MSYIRNGYIWTPRNESVLTWWDADLGVVVTGSGVSLIPDQSGAGDANRNIVQGTDVYRMGYSSSSSDYAGHAAILAGSGQFGVSGTWTWPTTCSIYAVAKTPSALHAISNNLVDSATRRIVNLNASSRMSLYSGVALDVAFSTSTKFVGCYVLNSTSSRIFVNSTTASATGDAGTTSSSNIYLGGYSTDRSWNSSFTTIMICNGIHTDAMIARTMRYFGDKYGIGVA